MSLWADLEDRSSGDVIRKEDRHQNEVIYAHTEGLGSYASGTCSRSVSCDVEEVTRTIKEQKKQIRELKKKLNELAKILNFY